MIPVGLALLLRAIVYRTGSWCRADHTWSVSCRCGCVLAWRDPGREHAGELPGMVQVVECKSHRNDVARRRINDLLEPEGACILGGNTLTGNVLWSVEALRPRPLP